MGFPLPEGGKTAYMLPAQPGASTGQMPEMYQANKKLNQWICPRADFGCAWDNVTDDTENFQEAIDAAIATGLPLRLPQGSCRITAALTVALAAYGGITITGCGRPSNGLPGEGYSYIRQDTANEPIFVLPIDLGITDCHFANFGIGWDAPSGTGNTDQIGFLFDGTGNPINATVFDCEWERISIIGAYTMFSNLPGTYGVTVWGNTWSDIKGWDIQHHCWDLVSSPVAGQPINTFRDIYINNANGSVESTGHVFDFIAVEATISGLDIEGWNNAIMVSAGGYSVDIRGVHIEHHRVVAGTTDYFLFYAATSFLSITNMSVAGVTEGTAVSFNCVAVAAEDCVVTLDDISMSWLSVVDIVCLVGSPTGLYRVGTHRLIAGTEDYTVAPYPTVLARVSGNTGELTRTGPIYGTCGAVPAVQAEAAAGAGMPTPLINAAATDVRGSVTFGTGSGPTAGAMVAVVFDVEYESAPIVTVTPKNAATAALGLFVPATATVAFTVGFATAPAASQGNTVYAFDYHVIG